jgi:hypothetical protein
MHLPTTGVVFAIEVAKARGVALVQQSLKQQSKVCEANSGREGGNGVRTMTSRLTAPTFSAFASSSSIVELSYMPRERLQVSGNDGKNSTVSDLGERCDDFVQRGVDGIALLARLQRVLGIRGCAFNAVCK